jgi:hypothetical protein
MIRDFRIENHLFSPHLRNGSYGAFFEQSTEFTIDTENTATVAASLWYIDTIPVQHPYSRARIRGISGTRTDGSTWRLYRCRYAENLENELTKTISTIESKVAKETGETTVNLASPLQLQKLLFETMQIKPLKKTKTGWSVDEETLTILAEDMRYAEIY